MSKYSKSKTDFLDVDKLFEQYKPLMGSIYKKFSKYNGVFFCQSDYEDLKAQIELEFVKLCNEYDPTRGVDFPGFIKFHLQQRVYHYVTKLQRRLANETTSFGKPYEEDDSTLIEFDNTMELIDETSIQAFEKIEALTSLDWRAIVGKKHKHLIEAILYEGKSIEDIAMQEGVVVKVIRLRLHFACERLKQWYQKQQDYEIYKKYHPDVSFDDYVQLRRQAMKMKREPILHYRIPTIKEVQNEQRSSDGVCSIPQGTDQESD